MAPETDGFGHIVRQLRLERNLGQTELAALAHLAQSTVSRLERGLRHPATARHVHDLALVLAANPEDADALYRAAGFLPLPATSTALSTQAATAGEGMEPHRLAEDFLAGRATQEWPALRDHDSDLPPRRTEIRDREALLRTAIALVNQIPPKSVRAGRATAIACSFQSADVFGELPELRHEWQSALLTAMARNWNIRHLVRLDQSAQSALGYVEEMLALVGSEAQGTYEPRYLEALPARQQPHDLLIVPRMGAMQFFSERSGAAPAAPDFGCFYPSDESRSYPLAPLRDQFTWFWSQAMPLARTYSLASPDGSFAYYDAVRNASEQDGSWNFVADGPSERTFPAVVDRQRLAYVIRLGGEKARIARAYVAIRRDRRRAFLRQIHRYRYREICPRASFERLLTSTEPGYDSLQQFGAPPETVAQRIVHLRQIVEDLVKYDNYELGLLGEEEARRYARTRWMMKEGYSVCLRVTRRNVLGGSVNLGLELRQPEVVEAFGRFFEHIWDGIEAANRDKRTIVGWLRQIIASLESREQAG